MLCAVCEVDNLAEAIDCANCRATLPAPGYAEAMQRAEVLYYSGNYAAALRLLNLAARCLATPAGELHAQVQIATARIHYLEGNYRLAEQQVQQALPLLGDSLSVHATHALGLTILANIAIARNDAAAAYQYTTQAWAEAQAANDRYARSIALNSRANLEHAVGNNATAIAYFGEALRLAQQGGDDGLASAICCTLAYIYNQQGDYLRSREYGHRALSISEGNSDDLRTAAALMALGEADMRVGDWDATEVNFDRALRIAQVNSNRNYYARLHLDLAELAWLRGSYATVLNHARHCVQNVSGDFRLLVIAYALQVHAALALQDVGLAERVEQQLSSMLMAQPSPGPRYNLYAVLTAAPSLYAARGDWPAATIAFEEAVRHSDNLDDRYTHAQVRLIYATTLLRHPQATSRTQELLTQALLIFTRLGTRCELQRTATLLTERKR